MEGVGLVCQVNTTKKLDILSPPSLPSSLSFPLLLF